MQVIKTTVDLPVPLHKRLQLSAAQANQNISIRMRELLDKVLAQEESTRHSLMYQALKKIRGIAKADRDDASATVDATLYDDTYVAKDV